MTTLNDRVAKLEQGQARGRPLVVTVNFVDQTAEDRSHPETGTTAVTRTSSGLTLVYRWPSRRRGDGTIGPDYS